MDRKLDFSQFCLKRILMNDAHRKMIAVEGNFDRQPESAVVVMEKYAFDEAAVMNVCNASTKLKTNMENDVYKSFSCVPPYDGKRLSKTWTVCLSRWETPDLSSIPNVVFGPHIMCLKYFWNIFLTVFGVLLKISQILNSKCFSCI